jgi:hypothetical protein
MLKVLKCICVHYVFGQKTEREGERERESKRESKREGKRERGGRQREREVRKEIGRDWEKPRSKSYKNFIIPDKT